MSEKTKPNSGEITRSHKRGKITVQFGELVISSDFDSGTNFGRLHVPVVVYIMNSVRVWAGT